MAEIKPGCLCWVKNVPNSNNGKVAEVLYWCNRGDLLKDSRFKAAQNGWLCRGDFVGWANSGVYGVPEIVFPPDCLIPFSDPDMDLSETKDKELTV